LKAVLMLGPVPPPFGGIASVMQTIIHSALANDYSFEVFEREHNIPAEFSGPVKRNVFRFKRFVSFFRKLRQGQYDFVHMHIPFGDTFLGTAIFMIIARIAGTKTLLHIHGTDWDTFYTRESAWLKVLYKIGLRIPKRIIVLYETWRINIKKLVPSANVVALANCLEDIHPPDSTLVESIRPELGLDQKNFIVLTVGFVGWRKGHLDILDAVPQVVRENDSVRFVFIGGEEYPGESDRVISRIKSENLDKWLLVTKEVQRSKVPAYLAAADVFLLPSRREGMPISILEAMRAGLSVVVTRVGAIPEMIEGGESGLLIEPGSPDAIAEAVINLSRDDLLRLKLGKGARKAFEKKYEVNACIRELASIYGSMSVS
jgi:glycosyltransferase involved in cell wall biosynthesis